MSQDITVIAKAATTDAPLAVDAKEVAPLAGFLGVNTTNETHSKQLESILNYFRDGKEITQSDLLHQIKELELRMGYPRIGETRIDRLYRYVKLNGEIKNLEKERNGLLR